MSKTAAFFTKKKLIYLGAIALVIIGGIYYQRSKKTTTAVHYKTAAAEKGTLSVSVSGSGNVIVDQSANIDPTITGTVANLAVNVGDPVKKGQTLFSIVNNDLSVSVAKSTTSYVQAQGSLESAEANLKQAKADYNDAKKSGSGKSSADKRALKEKVDAAEASVTSAQQSINSSLADLNNQRLNASKRNVTAPIDGTVNAINIKNGDDLSKLSSGSSRQVPVIIGDLNTLKAQVQVNEVDIPNVQIGQKVMLTFSAIDGLNVSGKVEKMDSLGTLASGVVTYNVTISFDTLDPRIKPEMSVSAAIITAVKQNVITVPNSAVKTQGGNSYVQVLVNNQPQNKPVEIGVSNNTETQIIGGISEGENVITQTITSGASGSSTSSTSSQRTGGVGGGAGGGGIRFLGR